MDWVQPEVVTWLTSRDMPVWTFLAVFFGYTFLTSKGAAKIPGALGALARQFHNRAELAALKQEKGAAASVAHYEAEVQRLSKLMTSMSARLDRLENENLKLSLAQTALVRFCVKLMDSLASLGKPVDVPSDLADYFNLEG